MKNILLLVFVFLSISCTVTKSTSKIHPFNGDDLGCENLIAYKLSKNNHEYVSINVDIGSIELGEKQAYGIGKSDVVEVVRRKFEGPVNQTLCTDVIIDRKPEKLLEETATEGIVELYVNKDELVKVKDNRPYTATIILRNVLFETTSIDYLRLERINVGWSPNSKN